MPRGDFENGAFKRGHEQHSSFLKIMNKLYFGHDYCLGFFERLSVVTMLVNLTAFYFIKLSLCLSG